MLWSIPIWVSESGLYLQSMWKSGKMRFQTMGFEGPEFQTNQFLMPSKLSQLSRWGEEFPNLDFLWVAWKFKLWICESMKIPRITDAMAKACSDRWFFSYFCLHTVGPTFTLFIVSNAIFWRVESFCQNLFISFHIKLWTLSPADQSTCTSWTCIFNP